MVQLEVWCSRACHQEDCGVVGHEATGVVQQVLLPGGSVVQQVMLPEGGGAAGHVARARLLNSCFSE